MWQGPPLRQLREGKPSVLTNNLLTEPSDQELPLLVPFLARGTSPYTRSGNYLRSALTGKDPASRHPAFQDDSPSLTTATSPRPPFLPLQCHLCSGHLGAKHRPRRLHCLPSASRERPRLGLHTVCPHRCHKAWSSRQAGLRVLLFSVLAARRTPVLNLSRAWSPQLQTTYISNTSFLRWFPTHESRKHNQSTQYREGAPYETTVTTGQKLSPQLLIQTSPTLSL